MFQKPNLENPVISQGLPISTPIAGKLSQWRWAKSKISEEAKDSILTNLYKEPLNPQQLEAISHVRGPMLVLAGAGSGKTRVITSRIAALVAAGVKPRHILAVTFTNKATDEMSERANLLLGSDVRARPITKTLHGFCVDILKEHANELGYSTSFKVIQDIDQDEYLLHALRKVPPGELSGNPKSQLEALRSAISKWKNSLIGPAAATGPLALAYQEYQRGLQRAGRIDCDDLLRLACAVFSVAKNSAENLAYWQKKFDFIMVDEFQDTNFAQFELLKLLSAQHRNLFVVGDDDQAIYGWRGADIGFIRNFPTEFPDSSLVKLEINYRSTSQILQLSNALMSQDKERHRKLLISNKGDGELPVFTMHASQQAEARWIARTILESERSLHSHIVLVRNQMAMQPIANEFQAAKIPYELWRKDLIHVGEDKRNILALLNCIDDPSESDMALIRILRFPKFELTDAEFERVMQQWDGRGLPLWQLLQESNLKISKAIRKKVDQVQTFIVGLNERHKERVQRNEALADLAVEAVVGLYTHFSKESFSEGNHNGCELSKWITRQRDYIISYEKKVKEKAKVPSMRGYLGHRERIRLNFKKPPGKITTDDSTCPEPVIISTIHAAKGLEFPVVFMAAMQEGILPSKQAINSEDDKIIAEERRLAYVGITRAEERVFFSCACKLEPDQLSRFAEESGAVNHIVKGYEPKAKQGRLFD